MSWVAPLGGVMIGASTYLLMKDYGEILGISGMIHSTVQSLIKKQKVEVDDWWKVSFLSGMALSSMSAFITGGSFTNSFGVSQPSWQFIATGLLVGVGTRMANGCTSGHMLCGISRLSPRSFVATITFFGVALLTSQIFHTAPIEPIPSPPLSMLTIACLQLPFVLYFVPTGGLPYWHKEIGTGLLGSLFGGGLILTGMVNPSRVLGFMNLPIPTWPFTSHGGIWDPSLLWIIAGGIVPNMIAWRWMKSGRPTFSKLFKVPTRSVIDSRLVMGSVLFGLGWGWSGICPGPAIVATTATGSSLLSWLASFVVGGCLANAFL
eukprot:TRINITY_DN5606_c0_g1_i1.p1 TRINITY_DN5606_c0_g1~~TRINITY_DN5606_c0_g1_i1.p1  ORF type:complete len:320 (-),score=61.20 TRINITY_DN5606_c0_g1_i1:51-1010(-)